MDADRIKNVAAALLEAQSKFPKIELSKVNPHFKSRYADLAEIMSKVRGPLRDAGLLITHSCPSERAEGRVVVQTGLIHAESGESLWTRVDMPLDGRSQNAQGVGSAITYGRRYGVCALLGIVADEDDDGNDAANPSKATKPVSNAQARREQATMPQDAQNRPPANDPPMPSCTPTEAEKALEGAFMTLMNAVNAGGGRKFNLTEIKQMVEQRAAEQGAGVTLNFVSEQIEKVNQKARS
jgi:hypothetical protein